MTVREKLRKQAETEINDKLSDDVGIKSFAYWIIYTMKLEAKAQNSGLPSWSADVNVLITNDEELEELYARWIFEEGET